MDDCDLREECPRRREEGGEDIVEAVSRESVSAIIQLGMMKGRRDAMTNAQRATRDARAHEVVLAK